MLMLAFAYLPESNTVNRMEDIPYRDLTKLVCGYGFSFPIDHNARKKRTKTRWMYNAVAQFLEENPNYSIKEYEQEEEYDD